MQMKWDVVFYDEIDSTNSEIRRLSQSGAVEGLVAMADRQSAGKGRRGRTWESPTGGNLYFSVLLRPQIDPKKAPMLTLLMAYSVTNAIDKLIYPKGVSAQIKWPNDVILSGKKVCGILTEMNLSDNQIDDVIIGVGVNVNTTEFPEELKEKATSVCLETGTAIDRTRLLEHILQEFETQYHDFLRVQNLSLIQEAYNQLLVNKECEVRVLEPGKEYQALALGINESGELLVQKADNSIEKVYAGEVSVRGIYGYV